MSPIVFRAAIPGSVASVLVSLLHVGIRPAEADIAWQPVPVQTRASFRGLSVARDGTIWVGGTQGTVIRSTDGGATWSTDTVPGAHSFDFRGVAAVDSEIAYVIVSSADTGRIYKTINHGRSWQLLYRNERPGVFLDGVGCWTGRRCLAAGDPIAGRFFVVTTDDGGTHWTQHDTSTTPAARSGEAAFAASNTTIIVGTGGRAWIATGGGSTGRVWHSADYGATWQMTETPIAAGAASAGIFSLAFCDEQHGVAVGGNYRMPDSTGAHVAISADGGDTWTSSDVTHATAYLSGAACVPQSGDHPIFVAVGPTGTFVAADGLHWSRASQDGFNAVAALRGRRLVAVSGDGVVATASSQGLAARPR